MSIDLSLVIANLENERREMAKKISHCSRILMNLSDSDINDERLHQVFNDRLLEMANLLKDYNKKSEEYFDQIKENS